MKRKIKLKNRTVLKNNNHTTGARSVAPAPLLAPAEKWTHHLQGPRCIHKSISSSDRMDSFSWGLPTDI